MLCWCRIFIFLLYFILPSVKLENWRHSPYFKKVFLSPWSLTYYHHERKVQHPSIYLHLCPSTSCLVLRDLLFYNLKPTPLKYSAITPAATSLSHHEFFFTVSFSSTKTYIKFPTIKKKKVPPWSHISLLVPFIWFSF